ncbi:MAG TPA: MarR family transcriptional regulator [Cytophagales bacterium]|jgi:DNA-binding MarR family transcriptional regulator|nr:MarR family transcriptional regulator [Cytophagales bacterium]
MKIEEEIKQPKFRNAHHKAVLNLLFTAGWVQGLNNEFFKEFGITGTQFNILRILRGHHPENISAKEIKSRMLDKNSDVSRLLDRLIAKKYVQKAQCKSDKRASDVMITKEGLKLLKSLDNKMDNTDSKIIGLTTKEANQLSDLLDKCRA